MSFKELISFQDVTVDDAHIKAINSLAARLERQNNDELATVKKRRQQLNERSTSLSPSSFLLKATSHKC